jgi:hypothetical protein
MRPNTDLAVMILATFLLGTAIMPAAAATSDDACTYVTQAQVTAALGISMAAGTHVTPTFTRTCTWTPASPTPEVKAITLNLQAADTFDAGKKMMQQTVAMMKITKPNEPAPTITPVSGVGDDAYYLDMARAMSLIVKKGKGAFKIAIYGSMSTPKRQAAEKTLAQQVASQM